MAARRQSYRPLTARQESILRFVVGFISEVGWPPSLREIGESFGIKSLRGVTVHLDAIERKGYISRPSTPRSIKILHPAYKPGSAATMLPLLKGDDRGNLLGEWNVERLLPVSAKIVAGSPGAFLVRVCGSAMTHVGVLARDLAVCVPQKGYGHGELVAVVLDDAIIIRSVEVRRGTTILTARWPEHPDIDVQDEQPCEIIGKVVGLMRDYEGEAF